MDDFYPKTAGREFRSKRSAAGNRSAEEERFEVAVRLIEHRLRSTIVHDLTGLSMYRVRSLWREIHKQSPVCGQRPSRCKYYQNNPLAMRASIFARIHELYVDLAGGIDRCDKIAMARHLLASYELYRDVVGRDKSPFSITDAWMVVEGLANGSLRLVQCVNRPCAAFALTSPARFRCCFCGRGLEPAGTSAAEKQE